MTGADVIAILGAVRKQAEALQGAVPFDDGITPDMARRFAVTCAEATHVLAEFVANRDAIEAQP